MSLVEAILLAFLGGMLLNLMPCVLPVLAVKVTSLASLGDDSRAERLRHGLGYSGGIIASMLVLAGAVIALKSAGQAVGWGFQFQQPLFVVALAAVMVLFALNLFGVYEFGMPKAAAKLSAASQHRDRRSFFEGILAVVLATPCTAPFMGTAIGFAMASHPLVIVAVFVGLGLGLAAPFVAVALVPGLYRLIPSPGPWMGSMKKILGFALLLTALWLTWLFGRIVGLEGVTALLGFLIALSFSAWIYGEVQYRTYDKIKTFALTVAVVASIAGGWWIFEAANATPEVVSDSVDRLAIGDEPTIDEATGDINWQDWTPTIVEESLSNQRPVFVNFTADWCVNCKANEREMISADSVLEVASEVNLLMVKADLTNMDDELVDELERHGRAGVPLYLVYSTDNPEEPEILPQVLTRGRLIDEFQGL